MGAQAELAYSITSQRVRLHYFRLVTVAADFRLRVYSHPKEYGCIGYHLTERMFLSSDHTAVRPYGFINVILSEAKDLVFRHERTTDPNNEILRAYRRSE